MGFIKKARASGFSLSEIEGSVQLLAAGKRSCADYSEAARAKLVELDEQIRVLRAARRELKQALLSCAPAADACVLAGWGR